MRRTLAHITSHPILKSFAYLSVPLREANPVPWTPFSGSEIFLKLQSQPSILADGYANNRYAYINDHYKEFARRQNATKDVITETRQRANDRTGAFRSCDRPASAFTSLGGVPGFLPSSAL
jgi:hypothetical protein